jgi:hypothetical protein
MAYAKAPLRTLPVHGDGVVAAVGEDRPLPARVDAAVQHERPDIKARKRPARMRLVNARLPRLRAAAARDEKLAAALVRAIGLKDRPKGCSAPTACSGCCAAP